MIPFWFKRKAPHTDLEPLEDISQEKLEAHSIFFQGPIGTVLGDGRFEILTKLGIRRLSNVWLAKDKQDGRHVALNILSGYATYLTDQNRFRELEIHQRLASLPEDEKKHCSNLITHFTHKGTEEDIDHLCLVLKLEQATLERILFEHKSPLPIKIIKRILCHVLQALSTAHGNDIVHADVQPGTIMVGLLPEWTTPAIDKWVKKNPPRAYRAPRKGHYYKIKNKYSLSQPLPVPKVKRLEKCEFKLVDFSKSQVDDFVVPRITPFHLGPPEMILGGSSNSKVDIWTFACMVFELMTRQNLFEPTPFREPCFCNYIRPKHRAGVDTPSPTEFLLWMMFVITKQRLPLRALRTLPEATKFFNGHGNMKRFLKKIPTRPIETIFHDVGCPASEKDIIGASNLMRRCLQLDPRNRPSAQELLKDPWLKEEKKPSERLFSGRKGV